MMERVNKYGCVALPSPRTSCCEKQTVPDWPAPRRFCSAAAVASSARP